MAGTNIIDWLGSGGSYIIGTVTDQLNQQRQYELEEKRLEVEKATRIEAAKASAAATAENLLQGNVFKTVTLWTITGIAGTVLGSFVVKAMRG
ncbi:MAG: hypothetical protein H6863_06550 [Rhodospirillales bacterium]|nr:hypothetical protein [Rhodospirillales bacterium]